MYKILVTLIVVSVAFALVQTQAYAKGGDEPQFPEGVTQYPIVMEDGIGSWEGYSDIPQGAPTELAEWTEEYYIRNKHVSGIDRVVSGVLINDVTIAVALFVTPDLYDDIEIGLTYRFWRSVPDGPFTHMVYRTSDEYGRSADFWMTHLQ